MSPLFLNFDEELPVSAHVSDRLPAASHNNTLTGFYSEGATGNSAAGCDAYNQTTDRWRLSLLTDSLTDTAATPLWR